MKEIIENDSIVRFLEDLPKFNVCETCKWKYSCDDQDCHNAQWYQEK
jgi:hypothetical protein